MPRTFTGWLLTALVILLLLWAGTWLLMLATPSWYRPPNPARKTVFNQADQAQAALLNLRNMAQDPKVPRIRWHITEPEINSMLAVAYGQTGTGQTASTVTRGQIRRFFGPFVRLQNGKITLAAVVHTAVGNSVASVTMTVKTLPQNGQPSPMGQVRIVGVHLGLAPLPPSLITDRLVGVLPRIAPSIQRMIAMYAGAGYARTATPQVLSSIRDVLGGKPFPLRVSFRYRSVTITQIRVLGPHLNAQGIKRPAELIIHIHSD